MPAAGSGKPIAPAGLTIARKGAEGNRAERRRADRQAADRGFRNGQRRARHRAAAQLPHVGANLLLRELLDRGRSAKSDRWWSISGRRVSSTEFDASSAASVGSGNVICRGGAGSSNHEDHPPRPVRQPYRPRQPAAHAEGLARVEALRSSRAIAPSDRVLFLLDLDRFKAVNDTLGHQTGDVLLKQVAQRLQRAVGDAGLVGRLGGDEFKVLLPGRSNRDRAFVSCARSIIEALLRMPMSSAARRSRSAVRSASRIAPEDGDDSDTLIRNADLALYAAKADGRGVHRFYRGEMLIDAQSRKKLEDDLRQALHKGEFHAAPISRWSTTTTARSSACAGRCCAGNIRRAGRFRRRLHSRSPRIATSIEAIGEWVMRTACRRATNGPRSSASPSTFRQFSSSTPGAAPAHHHQRACAAWASTCPARARSHRRGVPRQAPRRTGCSHKIVAQGARRPPRASTAPNSAIPRSAI